MIPEFWRWFSENANQIAADPSNGILIRELDRRISDTWPQLAWEIGPDPTGAWYLALSPNLNRDLTFAAQRAVSSAPSVDGWKLYPARPPKEWDGKFEMDAGGRSIAFDSSQWKYVLLRYPDGLVEVVMTAPESKNLLPDERWQAAAIVLEGLLGEDCILANIASFTLEPELDQYLSANLKPIQALRQVFKSAA
jgi:hypothetical protein